MSRTPVLTLSEAEGAEPEKLYRLRLHISRTVTRSEEQDAILEIVTTASNEDELTPEMRDEIWEFAEGEGRLLDLDYDTADDGEERVISGMPYTRCPDTPDMFAPERKSA